MARFTVRCLKVCFASAGIISSPNEIACGVDTRTAVAVTRVVSRSRVLKGDRKLDCKQMEK